RKGLMSMRLCGTWALLICALSLAACTTSASNCAGWNRINLKPTSAVYLAGNDVGAGQGIAAHNRYGAAQGCWH
ncbi:hypothetical protein, partial [Mesorhizobium sp.]|uniref:hypothetical protein n=1 Tax=Mesorhizobium sp. TaxID=1871066 RepID=UPI0025C522F5